MQESILKNNHPFSHGVNIIGHFNRLLGLGEAARHIALCLHENNIPYSLISVEDFATHHHIENFELPINNKFIYPINLICFDLVTIANFVERHHWNLFKNRHNIGLIYWETNVLPEKALIGCSYLDEIWVTSRYVQEQISLATRCPVHKITHPIFPPYTIHNDAKNLFNLNHKFTFLFSFDFSSSIERKNPMAIIKAFKQAFPLSQDIQLVIKTQNGKARPSQLEKLIALIKDDHRIHSIDQSLDSQQRWNLMNACDCYISLHCSEGLGLTMAEAMLLNKPVIATGYSGNLDFMNEENSFLCAYTLREIGKGNHDYPPTGIWAEANIDQAAFWMKYIVNNPIDAQNKAQKGKDFILKHHSLEATRKQIIDRLNKITIPSQSKKRPTSHLIGRIHNVFIKPLKKNLKKIIPKQCIAMLNRYYQKISILIRTK